MSTFEQSTSQHILLIDHQTDSAKNTAFLLRLAGYQVTISTEPNEALNILSTFCSTDNCPAIFLLNNPETTPGNQKLLSFLEKYCPDSTIMLADRGKPIDELAGNDRKIVIPHQILREIRISLANQSISDDASENFCRLHSCEDNQRCQNRKNIRHPKRTTQPLQGEISCSKK